MDWVYYLKLLIFSLIFDWVYLIMHLALLYFFYRLVKAIPAFSLKEDLSDHEKWELNKLYNYWYE